MAVAEASITVGGNGGFPQPSGACATRRSSNSGVLAAPLLPRLARQSLFFFGHLSEFRDLGKPYRRRPSIVVAVPPPTEGRYAAALLPRKISPLACGYDRYHPHPARDVAAFDSRCTFERTRFDEWLLPTIRYDPASMPGTCRGTFSMRSVSLEVRQVHVNNARYLSEASTSHISPRDGQFFWSSMMRQSEDVLLLLGSNAQ
ncbi:hypothetical protein LY76DRAFT_593574 [Colletotrichum caudatum]|nr:hypothetical protein LY76DRAFT_593574 [Colletotrichum caudatum]